MHHLPVRRPDRYWKTSRENFSQSWQDASTTPRPLATVLTYRPIMEIRRHWWIGVAVVVGLLAGWSGAVLQAAGGESSGGLGAVVWESPATQIPNPDFTQADEQASAGQERPAGWHLEGGQGRWRDRQLVELQGRPKGANYWRTEPIPWQPGRLYRFEFRARGDVRQGCVISGPEFANRDWHSLTDRWQWRGFVFRVPDHVQQSIVRVGFWEAEGRLECDAVRLTPVLPVHLRQGDLELGEGESIRNGVYEFWTQFDGEGANYHRPLASATAAFNTDRYCFSGSAQVSYRFQLPGRKFTTGRVQCHLNYHAKGGCLVEVSRDGQNWQPLARQDRVGQVEADVPAGFLPAEAVWVRLRTADRESYFQINQVRFTGLMDPTPGDLVGQTVFVEVGPTEGAEQKASLPLRIEELSLRADADTGQPELHARLANLGKEPVQLSWTSCLADAAEAGSEAGSVHSSDTAPSEPSKPASNPQMPPGQTTEVVQKLPNQVGRHLLRLMVQKADQTKQTFLRLFYDVSDYYRTDYGQLISQSEQAALWWCEAGWKVPRQRPAPEPTQPGQPKPTHAISQPNPNQAASQPEAKPGLIPPEGKQAANRPEAKPGAILPEVAAQLAACRNDREAVQVVVRPVKPLRKLWAQISDWIGPAGARIPASQTKILYVYYHYVHTPTDRTGVRDWWPDALPPLRQEQPVDVPAGQNQPIWILVHVPKDARPGLYQAQLTIQAEGFQTKVPIQLQVWDFTLPDRNRLETALGLSPHLIFQYHNLKTEEDQRKVLDMYFQSFAEHRISPYDPAPLDPIRVRWLPEADPPKAELDFTAFDRAVQQALEKYHFNTIMLHVQGMGGGTFHERYEPAIGKYTENTPQYQAMFSSYVRQLEDHLRAKGWLPMAYVYWFDEPDPKDYDFVTAGMERLRRYAPGLRRMLTEEPNPKLKAPVDIWCPVSFNYNHQEAEKERAKGAIFWWYVCCGPKAPYCTLFIDHPATELRVWLWQTWQRRIQGILIWSTNYWTSDAAYPDKPQNPYEDPMGYVSGYSTPKGVKLYWGNGDGRFLYPPLAAAVPGKSPGPVLEPPVSSIRWEMLREGVEDYEYLVMLRDLVDRHRKQLSPELLRQYESLLEVPPEITKDMTHFTTDPRPIDQRRAKIAQAIEGLGKM